MYRFMGRLAVGTNGQAKMVQNSFRKVPKWTEPAGLLVINPVKFYPLFSEV